MLHRKEREQGDARSQLGQPEAEEGRELQAVRAVCPQPAIKMELSFMPNTRPFLFGSKVPVPRQHCMQ